MKKFKDYLPKPKISGSDNSEYNVLKTSEFHRYDKPNDDDEYKIMKTSEFHKPEKINETLYKPTDPKLLDDNSSDSDLHKRLMAAHTTKDFARKNALRHYTGDSSTDINDSMHKKFNQKNTSFRDHLSKLPPIHASTAEHVAKLTSSSPAPEDFHVYTGIGTDPRNFDTQKNTTGFRREGRASKKEPYKTVTPSFMSTSTNPRTAYHFSDRMEGSEGGQDRHLLKIKVPKGSTHGAYIAGNSRYSSEHEFLMKPGLKLHINREPEIHDRVDAITKKPERVHIWHAEIAGNHYSDI